MSETPTKGAGDTSEEDLVQGAEVTVTNRDEGKKTFEFFKEVTQSMVIN